MCSLRVLCSQPLDVIRLGCRSGTWRPLSAAYERLWVRQVSRESAATSTAVNMKATYHVEKRANRIVLSSVVETPSKGFLRGLASNEGGNVDFRKVTKL